MPPERPPEPPGGTLDQAGPSEPRRRRRLEGETQSAGHTRRSHLSCDCGRGFNSHRLHWFARDRQSGTWLHDPVILRPDRVRQARRRLQGIPGDRRRSSCRRVAGRRVRPVAGQSQRVSCPRSGHARFRDDCECASSRGRDARVSSGASTHAWTRRRSLARTKGGAHRGREMSAGRA